MTFSRRRQEPFEFSEGDFFWFTHRKLDNHPWIVLSDPERDSKNILIVNLSSINPRKEQACVVQKEEHPSLKNDSCVMYGMAQITSIVVLEQKLEDGDLTKDTPVSPELLGRMRLAAFKSGRLSFEARQILESQGLRPDGC